MINPYIIAADEKDKAIIFGYVIDVKDRGDSNMLLFKKDTMDPSSDIIAVAAWGAVPGQNCSIDMRETVRVDFACVYAISVLKKRTVSCITITTLGISLNLPNRRRLHNGRK